ncbi:hypothetical protein D3C72_2591460 [compost metagenome]
MLDVAQRMTAIITDGLGNRGNFVAQGRDLIEQRVRDALACILDGLEGTFC